jgi:lipoprotein-anchoring transpeptidase ErfK/SrfK
VRLKKIVLGLSAVAALAGLAACSSGSNATGNSPALAANTGTSTVSQSSPATSTTTVAPTTTTTTPPPTTTKPPVTTTKPKPPVQAQTVSTAVPCSITNGACVSLSQRKTWLLVNGQVVYGPVHAEPGRTGWSTPVGTFTVTGKAQHYVSREFNAPMPYSTFFLPGIAFHEGSASTLSHGCIHLSLAAAEEYFTNLHVGETVQVVR